MRKHTIKRLTGDTKTADKIAKSDINQNEDATSALVNQHESSHLSESTIQAFQNALHYKPLAQMHTTNDGLMDTQQNGRQPEMVDNQQEFVGNSLENNKNNNNLHNGNGNGNFENHASFQGISLKDFEKHHRLMKEANLEKRKLLSNAIEQRYFPIGIITTIFIHKMSMNFIVLGNFFGRYDLFQF